MKKIYLSTLALATGLVVMAQGDPLIGTPAHKPVRTDMEVKTRFGIKAGVNSAKLSVKDDSYANPAFAPETNHKTSFHAGAFVNIPLGGNFRLQPELIWSGQGSKMQQETSTTTGTGTTITKYNFEEDLHYVNLPIMLQLQSPGGFYIETGPQLSYLVDAKQKGRSPISTTDETDLDPVRDNFDIAWAAGVGYNTRIGLGIGARYNYGLRNIVKESSSGNSQDDFQNRVIQVGLTYQFGAYK